MQYSRILILLTVLLLSISFACNKNNSPHDDAVAATLLDYTGLDGCTWVIKLADKEVLEPINLGNFIFFELKDGKKIWVKYKTVGMASICMVGPTIEIEEIWDR